MAKVVYEWDLETVMVVDTENYEAGEVVDHDHSDVFPGFNRPVENGVRQVVVLVRDVFTEYEGLVDRSWAYLSDDGTLPERFHQMDWNESQGVFERLCTKVPKRFHREIAAFVTATNETR